VSNVAATNSFNDLFHRLRLSLAWVAAQFWATLLLIFAGAAWTRLPDRYAWQVGLSLFVPLVLLAGALALQAGTIRKLFHDEQRRVQLSHWSAHPVWSGLRWFGPRGHSSIGADNQIPVWAGYLNSRASAHLRATLFTYDHIQSWLTLVEWIFRWIAVPAKVIPWATASAQWGWRLPIRKIIRLLFNWRWWLAVIAAALLAVEWPSHFFTGEPQGTVSHQVWAVILKLAGSYLLAIVCWVLLLAWCAVLLSRDPAAAKKHGDDSLVPTPVGGGPLGKGSVRLPLPEGGDDTSGNA
jgi:hypothetical protein